MTAPTYSTKTWSKGQSKSHFVAEASDLGRDVTKVNTLWGWNAFRTNAGAYFQSHKTGDKRFFEVIARDIHDGDTRSWTLIDRQGIVLTVFND